MSGGSSSNRSVRFIPESPDDRGREGSGMKFEIKTVENTEANTVSWVIF